MNSINFSFIKSQKKTEKIEFRFSQVVKENGLEITRFN